MVQLHKLPHERKPNACPFHRVGIVGTVEAVEDVSEEPETEEVANKKWDKFKKRQDTMKELFDRLRGKFMELFEDIDDDRELE